MGQSVIYIEPDRFGYICKKKAVIMVTAMALTLKTACMASRTGYPASERPCRRTAAIRLPLTVHGADDHGVPALIALARETGFPVRHLNPADAAAYIGWLHPVCIARQPGLKHDHAAIAGLASNRRRPARRHDGERVFACLDNEG
jgi:hypothetical protein